MDRSKDGKMNGIKKEEKEEDESLFHVLLKNSRNTSSSMFSFSRSLEPTSSCESGRSAVVTLRCNPAKSIKGDLSVPRYQTLLPMLRNILAAMQKKFIDVTPSLTRPLQPVPGGNLRRLHLPFPVGELGGVSDVHGARLPSDRGRLQGGAPGALDALNLLRLD